MSLVRLLIPDGMEPLKALRLRLKLVTFGNAAKSSRSRVASRLALGRLIWETDPPALQRRPLHLQRLGMLVSDHEERDGDGDEKVFLHLTRAPASVVGEGVAVNVKRKM